MSARGTGAPVARLAHRRRQAPAETRTIDAAAAAWIAALACALPTALAILLLGPLLGDLLRLSRGGFTFLPGSAPGVYDESTEHARYLLALAAPLLLTTVTWRLARRAIVLPTPRLTLLVAGAQATTVALLVACVVVQYRIRYGAIYTRIEGVAIPERYFNPATLVAAGCVAGMLLAGARWTPARTRIAAWLRETSRRRLIGACVAIAVTAVWMLHAVNSEESIATAVPAVRYHLEFTLDEAFAVINGMTPLVDFTPQYSSLWPYLSALTLATFGKTVLVFTLTMCTLTGIALLAVYGVLRRTTRSSPVALLLYLPVLAMSFFSIGEASTIRTTFGTYFGIFPLRYAGPYLVAWLTARRLDRNGGHVGGWPTPTA